MKSKNLRETKKSMNKEPKLTKEKSSKKIVVKTIKNDNLNNVVHLKTSEKSITDLPNIPEEALKVASHESFKDLCLDKEQASARSLAGSGLSTNKYNSNNMIFDSELCLKTDRAVFNALMDPSVVVKYVYHKIFINSVKIDKNGKINIIFRAENPQEFGIVQILKQLLKIDRIKACPILKESFARKFQNSEFTNTDLNLINSLLKQIQSKDKDSNLSSPPLQFDPNARINELFSVQNDKHILRTIKEKAIEVRSRMNGKALNIDYLKNLILNNKLSAFIHRKMH